MLLIDKNNDKNESTRRWKAVVRISEKRHQQEKERRTRVNTRQALEWREKKHEDDTHAKYLNTPAGHIQHERLHGKLFRGRYRKVPCAFVFKGLVGRGCVGCGCG